MHRLTGGAAARMSCDPPHVETLACPSDKTEARHNGRPGSSKAGMLAIASADRPRYRYKLGQNRKNSMHRYIPQARVPLRGAGLL